MTMFRALQCAFAAGAMLTFAACGGNQADNNRGGAGGDTTATASGSAGSSGDKLRLEFWHYLSGVQINTVKDFITAFEKENPDITINPVYQGRAQDLAQKLNASFATSPANNPVICTMYESWTDDYVAKNLMDPVEDHFAGPEGLTKEEQDDFIKVFRDANSWNGKMVTLPFNKSIYLLYANMDMLAKEGFTTTPRNLTEMKDAVTKLTKTTGRRSYGYGVAPASESFTTLLYAGGGEHVDKDGKVAFNSPQGLAALQFLRDMQFPNKNLYVSTEYMNAPFGNEMIAMYTYSSASLPFNQETVKDKFQWAAAPIPGQEGNEPRYLMQGTNVGIFNNRSEAERKAAWKFLKYITSTKNAVTWATKTGYMPIRYSVVNDPEMQAYMQKNPRYAAASSLVIADKGKQEPRMAVWEGVRTELDTMVDRILNRPDADAKTELEATAKKVAERLASVKK